MIDAFIDQLCDDYPVVRLCTTVGVSKSGYYAWKARPISQHEREDGQLIQAIEACYQHSWQTYGSPRVHVQLQRQGYRCSRKRVARLMRQQGWCARERRKRTHTTQQHPGHKKAANVLNREFQASAPNQKWVADVTAVWTQEGWLYVAGVLDLYSRALVGWAMAPIQDEELVQCAFRMALLRRHPQAGLLHHSDRGCLYTSTRYRQAVIQAGMVVSMSRTGNCYDNAAMESFWSTLKWECVHRTNFSTCAQARQAIFEYIEVFYNRQRLHSSLGYLSPSQFEGTLISSTH